VINLQIFLYQLRKEKGLTQKGIADKLGISSVSYRNKEQSKNAFTQDEMFILSKFFRKSMHEIFLPRK